MRFTPVPVTPFTVVDSVLLLEVLLTVVEPLPDVPTACQALLLYMNSTACPLGMETELSVAANPPVVLLKIANTCPALGGVLPVGSGCQASL